MARRFYINKQIEIDDKIVFEKEDYNHIINVLRFKLNDELIICNGSEFDFYCILTEIEKRSCSFLVTNKKVNNVEAKSTVDVFQALIKGEKFELLAQKLTELGVNKLVPFSSSFVQVKENTTRLNRLEKISIEAVKQCGRAKPLVINDIVKFNEILLMLKEYDLVIFAYENSKNNLDFSLLKGFEGKKIAIVIGSEGGFSKQEEQALLNLENLKEISLGKRILRAETATIALTSAVMCLLNEWKI